MSNEVRRPGDWYQDDLFKLACCFHFHRFEPVGANWDAEAYLAALRCAGVKAVTLEAKDSLGYRYYEAKHGVKHPLVKSDYYGERARVLRENGIKVIAYFGLGDDSAAFEKRPELRMDLGDGKLPPVHSVDKTDRANLNSPYFEEIFLAEVREFLAAYHPDAIWLDIFTADPYWGLSCDHWTAKLFEERTGRKLLPPDQDPAPRETARFFIRYAEEMRKRIYDELKKISPETLVAINSSFRYPRREGIVTDFLSRDTYWGYCGEIVESGYYARLWSATGKPSEIISPAYRWWGEKDRKSAWQIEREAASALAAGSTYMCYWVPRADGVMNPRMCAEIGAVRGKLEAQSAWFKAGQPLPDLALFTCSASEEEFSCRFIETKAKGDYRAQTNDRYFAQDFECAARFFTRHGYNYGVQTELTLEHFLKSHHSQCLVAPHLPVLDDRSRELLLEFVRGGGLLVLTGAVDPGLAAAIGLAASERPGPERAYVRSATTLNSAVLGGLDIPVPVPFQLAGLAGGETLLEVAPLLNESHFAAGDWFNWGYPDADLAAYGFGAGVTSVGKGKVLYYAFNPFFSYAHEPSVETAALIADPLAAAGFRPAVKLVEALPVELLLRGDEMAGKFWCHLINHTEAFEPGRKLRFFPGEFAVPLRNFVFAATGPVPAGVRLQPGNRELAVSATADGWQTTLPELGAHAIVEWTFSR
ncbi:MAG: alpha-L-fucosidase [Victivallaceae bacterium]